MNDETKRTLGWALAGALVLAVGLLAMLVDATPAKLLGGVAVWVGGTTLAVSLGRVAVRLTRV